MYRARRTVGVSTNVRIMVDPSLCWPRVLRSVPKPLMFALRFGVAAVEQRVVVVQVEMVRLQPHARCVHRVAMGGNTAGPLVDVGADVLGAGDAFIAAERRCLAV